MSRWANYIKALYMLDCLERRFSSFCSPSNIKEYYKDKAVWGEEEEGIYERTENYFIPYRILYLNALDSLKKELEAFKEDKAMSWYQLQSFETNIKELEKVIEPIAMYSAESDAIFRDHLKFKEEE